MRKPRILIVEDETDVLKANRLFLEAEGYEVTCAINLKEARNVLWERPPDLILLDVLLPDGSGYDFCGEVRGRTSASIIFLTCMNSNEQIVDGFTRGADDYITKPYSMLVNLVSNAAQHTQNGAITIRVSADRDFAAVVVADTGEGMGEEQLARLFGRYSTGAEVEKAGGGRNTGTGLGLYICRHILEEHGGEITVRSEMGKGTSVRFTLPRA